MNKKIIIEGMTESGTVFRPSDWAERICGALSTIKDHREYYSPLLRPILCDHVKCIILDPALEQENPDLYQHILEFAKTNRLIVRWQNSQ